MGNSSGFEKKAAASRSEIDDYMQLSAVLSATELKVVMAFRDLRPGSVLKIAMDKTGEVGDIFLTHTNRVKMHPVDRPKNVL